MGEGRGEAAAAAAESIMDGELERPAEPKTDFSVALDAGELDRDRRGLLKWGLEESWSPSPRSTTRC